MRTKLILLTLAAVVAAGSTGIWLLISKIGLRRSAANSSLAPPRSIRPQAARK